MDDLFDRIRGARPDPLVLTADELARLEAWAKAHGLRLPYAEKYKAWKAERAGQPTPEEIARRAEWVKHLKFVLEFNRARRAMPTMPADSQSPPAPPEAVAARRGDDAPDEHGYVALPSDPAAYVPLVKILTHHVPGDMLITSKEIVAIVEDYGTNRVRWTRPFGKSGRPTMNRRSIHLADWAEYLKRRKPTNDFPRLSEAEIARRTAAVRAARPAGK